MVLLRSHVPTLMYVCMYVWASLSWSTRLVPWVCLLSRASLGSQSCLGFIEVIRDGSSLSLLICSVAAPMDYCNKKTNLCVVHIVFRSVYCSHQGLLELFSPLILIIVHPPGKATFVRSPTCLSSVILALIIY